MSLETDRILIIGGSSGMGLATARRLGAAGARPIIAGRNAARLGDALATLPAGASAETVDFSDEASIAALFDRVGAIDHLMLCASSGAAWGPFAALETAAVRAAFDNKFWGYWMATRLALPYLAERGSILMVTGAAGRAALPGTSGLAAVNAAIAGLARTLAVELAPRRVNVLSPGLVDTEAYGWMPADHRASFFADAAAKLPAGRIGAADDIAAMAETMLANPFLTGAVIDLDGGASLYRG